MDVVEEHVGDKHPSEAFRFEVLQETIEFLQDLLECPVCKGSFMWKNDFIQHVQSVHCLDDLAEYLREHFYATFPAKGSVPRSLFRNLLPEMADFEEVLVEQSVLGLDESGRNAELGKTQEERLNDTASICVQQSSTKDGERVLQFHCETCNYTSYDYEKYATHLKIHSCDKPESLIKKLLTKSVTSSSLTDQNTDGEIGTTESYRLPVTVPNTSTIVGLGPKTRGAYHCHMCPFQCTKTVHFKRHLAIHARNETLKEGYKCGYCQFAHYRLNCVKFHLGKYHGDLPNKMIRIVDGIEIELGIDDDPGKVRKSPMIQPSASAPVLRTASEKRPTVRYEESQTPSVHRARPSISRSSLMGIDMSSDMTLAQFELELPPSMIYPEPVKCPKCDFTNRVRINLIRHLKLHREESEPCGEMPYDSPTSTYLQETSELRRLIEDDGVRTLMPAAVTSEPMSGLTNKRSIVLDEKPLLRSILCEKPMPLKVEPEDEDSEGSNDDSTPSEDQEPGTTSRHNDPKDYTEFSIRVPNTDQYQCKECSFMHRYPSKVKRHFWYKHVSLFPYRCGYCTFEAVESGKVKRHCQQMHRTQPELVIKSDVFASAVKKASEKSGTVMSKERDDVKIIDETISGENGDGQGDRWLAQFVIKVDNNLQCCKLCGYQQEGASSLKRHVYAKHLKFYPFSCNYCGVALMEIYRVKKHIEKYHAGLPFVVVRRHFEDMPQDGGELNRSSVEKVYVKSEPEDIEEEAPQLDFYPKNEEYSSATHSWKGHGGSVDRELVGWKGDKMSDGNSMEVDEVEHSTGGSHRRLFKCFYCGMISKWNRRDIRLHIMHVHMKRRVYTCRHCSFGNSKSKGIVKSHCAKFHPNKPVSVRDDIGLFNAVVPVEDKNGIVTMAFCSADGVPILTFGDVEPSDSHKSGTKSQDQKTESLSQSSKAKTEDKGLRSNVKPGMSGSSPRKTETPLNLSSRVVTTVYPAKPATNKSGSSGKERNEWRCNLCGFANQNASHVKYHLICYHLKLKPFSCPYCHMYIWKSQGVINHIEKHHPGREKKVYATVEEKASYLCANMERVPVGSRVVAKAVEEKEEVEEEKVVSAGNEIVAHTPKIGYFRCGICGYQDVRNDKTKYHIIKQHLKLRQFSCPHCHLYMWGRQQVIKHIEEEHPGMEIAITRTFQEYEEYLKQTITKVSGSPSGAASEDTEEDRDESSALQQCTTSAASPGTSVMHLRCNKCSFVTDSEMSLSAHKRSHRMYQCFHCDFRHVLAAKVQIHCLAKHPNKLVKYRQFDTSSERNIATHSPANLKGNDGATDVRKNSKMFHPCDACPAHFNTASELEQHMSSEHRGMYICNYCHIVMWNSASIYEHLRQTHPDRKPNYRLIKKELAESSAFETRKRTPMRDCSGDDEDDDDEEVPRKIPKVEQCDDDDDVRMGGKKSDLDQAQVATPHYTQAVYKCRLCNYRSGKVTVMRHHAMSHLRYHPYLCPYCDLVRSVKSFPITKHVRSKHPNCELKFFYARNEELEAQVKNSYYRDQKGAEQDSVSTAVEDSAEKKEAAASAAESETAMNSTLLRKVLYKCAFCSLKTHIRTDMKHHLMREIQYKPYRCMYCTYTEPCKWSMRKHFRTKHGGIEVEVEDMRDAENDARVEKLLEKCTVLLKHSVAPELMSSSTTQRNIQDAPQTQKPSSTARPKMASTTSNFYQRPTFGSSLLKRSFKSTKAMAIKFHRCPHCAYTNTSLKLVRGHMVKHGPFRLQCGYCDYRGHYPSRIRKHMRRHHPSLPFKCTKVALPPKERKTEQIPVIHMPRAQMKLQSRAAPGTVFLDGVPMDIPLIPDSEGWYRCLQCDYQSVNREHFKMHVVIHRPPKWKCFYCDQKYPVIFRLRRHSNQKHPNMPIKWIDTETGQASVDTLRPTTMTNRQGGSGHQRQRETARKSISKGARLHVALFKSQRDNAIDQSRSQSPNIDSDSTIVENTPFVIGEPYTLVNSDTDAIDSEAVSVESGILRLCCHLCSFTTTEIGDFAHHLETNHAELNDSVTIEVLPDDEIFALHRCGFCLYETYVEEEFEMHVRTHTKQIPLLCEQCNFASFNRNRVEEHIRDCHPDAEVHVQYLNKPYTMSASISSQLWSVNLDAFVEVEDIMTISDLDFESMLCSYGVSYQREPYYLS